MSLLDEREDALSLSPVEPVPHSFTPTFLRAASWPGAPAIAPRGDPYDDHGRFDLVRFPNFVSTRICLRFDLQHPSVPALLACQLAEQHPSDLGEDGALYLYESGARSQHLNAARARETLIERIETAQAGGL